MSSSNYRRNLAAVERFRKELKDMVGDIKEIDKRVLNKAVNSGVSYAKRNTPVGLHPNPVTFTVKNGKFAGTVVSFKVAVPGVGGDLRKRWGKTPTIKSPDGVSTQIINPVYYGPYWNYGHRIVTKKGGPTKGFVKGSHVLEKTQNYVNKRVIAEFAREVSEVQKRHDN